MRYELDEAGGGMADPAPDRGPNEFYFAAWRKAFHLFGVASRTEFWSFTLVNLSVFVVLFVVSSWTIPEPDLGDINYLALLLFAFMLVVPVPTLTVAIRRIRDVTGNGWFALLLLLTCTPFVGSVVGTLAGRKLHEAEISGSDRGYVDVWRDTPDWLGRSTRKEFWSFNLVNALVLLGVVGGLTVLAAVTGFPSAAYTAFRAIGPLEVMLIVGVVISTPLLPIAVRRVRDATGSGWWVLTWLIPLVGWIIGTVLFLAPTRDESQLSPSEPSDNGTCSSAENRQYDDDDPWPPQRTGTNGQ